MVKRSFYTIALVKVNFVWRLHFQRECSVGF